MAEEERRVVLGEPEVHHHLGHVDRPALGEDAAPEDRRGQRRRAVAVDALEVVAGHRLVDRQQLEHPVVVLAEVRLGLVRRPLLGDRRHREERLLAAVERTRRVEHRPAERAQEDRRPADVERLVGEADDVALAAERLDPAQLRAAEVEDVVGGRMLDADRVDDPPDRLGIILGRGRVAAPGRPDLAGDPDHLRPGRIPLAPGAGLDRRRRELGRAEGVDQLLREQLAAQAALAVRRRQHDVGQVPLERVERGSRAVRRRAQPGHDLGDGRVAGCRGPLALGQRVADQVRDAGPLGDRLLGVEAGHRPVARAEQRPGGVEHRGDALEAPRDRRQPLGQRRELAGDQREQPVAQHVDPLERAPGVLAELRLGEAVRGELAEQQVAIDPVVDREPGDIEALELARPAIVELEPRGPAGGGHRRPFGVVGVHPRRGRGQRMEGEVLAEERIDAGGEVGHGLDSGSRAGRRVYRPRPDASAACRTIAA